MLTVLLRTPTYLGRIERDPDVAGQYWFTGVVHVTLSFKDSLGKYDDGSDHCVVGGGEGNLNMWLKVRELL